MTVVRHNEHIITAKDSDGDDCIILSPYLLSLGLDYCIHNKPLNYGFGWKVNCSHRPVEEGLTEEELTTYYGLYVNDPTTIANEILELFEEKTNA